MLSVVLARKKVKVNVKINVDIFYCWGNPDTAESLTLEPKKYAVQLSSESYHPMILFFNKVH